MAKLAKTRLVCVSDTHNQTPRLPKGDVLICAGDFSNQGTRGEVERFVGWVEGAGFEKVVVIGGNHDITLDTQFYKEHWQSFHNQAKQSPQECQALLKNSPSITYLQHESAVIKLSSPEGPHTSFSIFGSPYSPSHKLWAFGYKPDAAKGLWDQIPMDTDVVVTHTPPAGHCDQQISKDGMTGCEELRRRLWTVRPLLHVCGHTHEGRGVEKVKWRDSIDRAPFLEESVEIWEDPGWGEGNRKQSLVDLTGRGRGASFRATPMSIGGVRIGLGYIRDNDLGIGRSTMVHGRLWGSWVCVTITDVLTLLSGHCLCCLMGSDGCLMGSGGCLMGSGGCLMGSDGCLMGSVGCLMASVGCLMGFVGCLMGFVGCPIQSHVVEWSRSRGHSAAGEFGATSLDPTVPSAQCDENGLRVPLAALLH
ncbi:Metallo-dependent phosphatase [Venturia nashicola]|uniref:Metallo-dependent phosphatase n=1 Tax=Venturia nashicola TaxID=86259 RepID=A0A4Z1PGQ0_9PEZI|nr:Metallo-dependent phosphatase [Venturia nashicola]